MVDGAPATVIGVAPRRFFGVQIGAAPEIWLPVAMEPLIQTPSRRASGELTMSVMARVKPDVPLDQARAQLRAINRDRIEEIAKRGDLLWRQATIDVVPAAAGMSRLTFVYARPLFALMGLVGLHVGHKTDSASQWLWSTFEHVDNFPTEADVASGKLDTAVVWGPLAGFYARRSRKKLRLTPVQPDHEGALPFAYDLAVGVAKNKPELAGRINRVLAEKHRAISLLLTSYGIPQLNSREVMEARR